MKQSENGGKEGEEEEKGGASSQSLDYLRRFVAKKAISDSRQHRLKLLAQ